jgi:exodeoxyribonuclease-5
VLPNKTRSVTRSLIKDAANRTTLTTDQLMDLHAKTTRVVFSSCMVHLEADPHNIFRRKTVLEKRDPPVLKEDSRYLLLHDLITAFVLNDPEYFWDPKAESAEPEKSDPSLDELFGSIASTSVAVVTDRPNLKWNDQQSKALKSVFKWYETKSKGQQVFRLFGYAGTGKTTLAKEIAWCIENGESGGERGEVLFAAYTGKAASVLASKGCLGATTLHSLIYKPQIDYITGKVKAFALNPESPLCQAKLLICDEMSMVNDELGTDLMSFGIPILVLGDPAQVKPIKGEGFFTRADADITLTDVERVASENPLIWLATEIRNGRLPKPGRYGDSRVYRPGFKVPDELIMETDQIIVGINTTRAVMNRRHRKLSGKFDQDTQFPVRGDKLMCTKNNKQNGFLNGTQWTCSTPELKPMMKLIDYRRPELGFEATRIEGLHFKVRALDLFDAAGKPMILDTVCSTHHFDENLPEPFWKDIAGTDAFTFAYAGTVHKLQGSQFAKTLVIDESGVFADQQWNHLYTAATRASESMDLVLSEY